MKWMPSLIREEEEGGNAVTEQNGCKGCVFAKEIGGNSTEKPDKDKMVHIDI